MKRFLYILTIVLLIIVSSCRCSQQSMKSEEISYKESVEDIYIPDEDGDGVVDFEEVDLDVMNYEKERLKRLEQERIEQERIDHLQRERQLSMQSSDPSSWTSNEGSNQGIKPEDKGTLVYKVDSVLIIGVVSRVEARIIKQVSQEITDHLVSITTHTATGVIYEEVIKVGNIMDMELKSLDEEAITVNPISGEQPVDEEEPTLWIWGITANKIGDYNLILTARVKMYDFGTMSRIMPVFDKKISVINKPKKKYTLLLDIPNNLKRYEDSIVKITIVEKDSDAWSFDWGGEGKILVDFDGDFTLLSNDNIFNDKKSSFEYKWTIKTDNKEKTIPFKIRISGDYTDEVLIDTTFIVENNFKEGFNKFIDNAAKRWYWLFTALLIPIYGFIRKKYFIKKTKS